MRKIKIINIALIFMLIRGGLVYSVDISCLRIPFRTQDISQNRKILISQIQMSVMAYKRKEEHYPLITDEEIFSNSVLKEMEKLGVKVYRESDDCMWIYSEEDNYYMRLSKKSQYIYFAKKKTEEEILTREEIESVERAGAGIRVFKGHDAGSLFEIFKDLQLVHRQMVSIDLSLDEHTKSFGDDLMKIASDIKKEHIAKIEKIILEPAALSKEGTLTILEAKNAIQDMRKMLQALKEDRQALELIYEKCKVLYKGEEDLSKDFKEGLLYMDKAIGILESRVEIAMGITSSYPPQSITEIIENIVPENSIIKIENKLPKDIKINANRLTISNALINIITNAVYFAEKKNKKRAKVKIILSEQDGKIKIDIIDNGDGVSEKLLQINPITKRLDLFTLNTSDRKSGSGLGMTDAWYAIKDHGGTINVQSELGKGTTFTITLPGQENILTQFVQENVKDEELFTLFSQVDFETSKSVKMIDDRLEKIGRILVALDIDCELHHLRQPYVYESLKNGIRPTKTKDFSDKDFSYVCSVVYYLKNKGMESVYAAIVELASTIISKPGFFGLNSINDINVVLIDPSDPYAWGNAKSKLGGQAQQIAGYVYRDTVWKNRVKTLLGIDMSFSEKEEHVILRYIDSFLDQGGFVAHNVKENEIREFMAGTLRDMTHVYIWLGRFIKAFEDYASSKGQKDIKKLYKFDLTIGSDNPSLLKNIGFIAPPIDS
ncbi:MAG: HAMP domain-containing histidine kinase [Candidatus Omnitrophica bacterium]|nr:HAMP domain-containing histidine kinase [Candidatus Omnitrophota bacterium]